VKRVNKITVNFVVIGQTVAEIWLFFDFAKMAAVHHLGFVMCVSGQPQRAFGGLYHCAKFGWNRHSGFDNTQVLILCDLGLKTPIYAPKIGVLPKRGELGLYLTQCGLGQDLPPHQVPSSSIQPFGHNTPTL